MKKILWLVGASSLMAFAVIQDPSLSGTLQGRGLRAATSGQVKTVNSIVYYESGDNITSVLAAIGSRKVTLVMDTIAAISANTTIPSNVNVQFSPYGGFNVATTKTLTILNMTPPGRFKVFYQSGTGNTLVPMGISKFPEWWGAVPDGSTSSDAAVQAAILSKGVVDFDTGTYILSSPINLVDLQIVGKGVKATGTGRTVLKFNALDTAAAFYARLSANSSIATNSISNVEIFPNSWTAVTGSRGYGMNIESPVTITNVFIHRFFLSGIFLHGGVAGGGPYNSIFTNVNSEYNGQHGILVGTGANLVLFVQPYTSYNGATAYGVAPVGVGLYDGFRVQMDSAGNPGGEFQAYSPEGIKIVGGNTFQNSNYGWNFSQAQNSTLEPGFAENNFRKNIYLGDGVSRCTMIFPMTDSVDIINDANTYRRENILFARGRLIGYGTNRESWMFKNLRSYIGASSNFSKQVYSGYDTALNRHEILASGGASTKIGTSNFGFISTSLMDTILGKSVATGSIGIGVNSANGGAFLDIGGGVASSVATGTTQWGTYIRPVYDSSATTAIFGLKVQGTGGAGTFTTPNYNGIRITDITKGANQTVTNSYGMRIDDITAGGSFNAALTTGLGLVTFGDKVGIGGSTNAGAYLTISPTALQATGTTQYALLLQPTHGTDATTAMVGAYIAVTGANGTYTTTTARGVHIQDIVKGSVQTVTNSRGIEIASIVAGSSVNEAIKTGTGIVNLGDATDATNATTAAVKSAGGYAAAKGIAIGTNLRFGANILASATAPTISSGFGTTPSVASNNGTAAFTINVGTGGTASTGVIGLPTATTGWNCFCNDITTFSATVFMCRQTASSTTTASIGQFTNAAVAQAWTASDILRVSCFAY